MRSRVKFASLVSMIPRISRLAVLLADRTRYNFEDFLVVRTRHFLSSYLPPPLIAPVYIPKRVGAKNPEESVGFSRGIRITGGPERRASDAVQQCN